CLGVIAVMICHLPMSAPGFRPVPWLCCLLAFLPVCPLLLLWLLLSQYAPCLPLAYASALIAVGGTFLFTV
ncbi:MAG: hypothetical protein VXW78_04765, partial [Pseudomonadota bacterium]|nr:hypothetical protein [Pseudomonadota bacterium]